MVPLSDESLLAGMAAGDPLAAAALVRRYQARVFGLARTIVGSSALAEDVAQEAFLKAWRHAGAYDARRGRVATWLLMITRNAAIDAVRYQHEVPTDPSLLLGALAGHPDGPQKCPMWTMQTTCAGRYAGCPPSNALRWC